MIRVAVIGVGAMGRNHVRVYSELDNVDLIAIADPDREAADRIGRKYRIRVYSDYREMLRVEELEAVSIVVPSLLHREVAIDCLEAGCHVLVEKPIASSSDDALAIIDTAEKLGRVLLVGHVERFNPAVIEAKRRIEIGELGKIFQIHARRLGPFPARIRDVGVVIDLATHDVDIMSFLTGSEVTRVHSETERRIHTAHEDLLSGLLRFRNGVIGVLDINWLTPTKIRELTITGERGMFLVNYLTQDLYFFKNDYAELSWDGLSALSSVSEGNMIRVRIAKEEPLRAELRHFVSCAWGQLSPIVSGEDGLRALILAQQLVDAGERIREEEARALNA